MKRAALNRAAHIVCFLALCASTASMFAQNKYFTNWRAGADPKTVGDRVAQHFLDSPRQGTFVNYPEVCIWYGSLAYADVIGDEPLPARLQARFLTLA